MKIILMLILTLLFVSCSQDPADIAGDVSISDELSSEITDKTVTELKPDLEAVDYEKAEVTFVCKPQAGINFNLLDIKADEQNGDPINDAVYMRNLAVQEKYNIIISVFEVSDRAGTVRKMVAADDDTYDAALTGLTESFQLGYTDHVYNLNDIPHLDFTMPWWNNNVMTDSEIKGNNFFAIGDMNILSYEGMGVMMFTKEIINTYDFVSPYVTVKNGNWTMDRFMENCKLVYDDLNGNGEYDRDDRYGFTCNEYVSDCFAFCTDMKYVIKDSSGDLVSNIDNEKFISYFTKIIEFINDETLVLYADKPHYKSERQTLPLKLFTEGRSLYYVETMAFITQLRDMEIDFGLIPFPKYDESQINYSNFIHDSCSSAVVIPVTNTRTDMIGRIIEDMAYYSYMYVRSAYYDVTLEGKYIRDDDSYEMLDYILLDAGCDLAQVLRGSGFMFIPNLRSLVTGNQTTISSTLASNESKYNQALADVNEKLSQQS